MREYYAATGDGQNVNVGGASMSIVKTGHAVAVGVILVAFCIDEGCAGDRPTSWEGWYVGANVGYRHQVTYTNYTLGSYIPITKTVETQVLSDQLDDVLGGIQVGYNWQVGRWVYGFETDLQATGQKNSQARFDWMDIGGYEVKTEITQNARWIGTARGRFGLILDSKIPFLVYITGGFAYAEVQAGVKIIGHDINDNQLTQKQVFSTLKMGAVAGFGIESLIGQGWSAKVEFLYIGLTTTRDRSPFQTNAWLMIQTPPHSYLASTTYNSRIN